MVFDRFFLLRRRENIFLSLLETSFNARDHAPNFVQIKAIGDTPLKR